MKPISAATAQTIVDEIGKEIGEHLNFMDQEGIIIASTDAARIGTRHEGARRIILEKLAYLYVSKEMETATTRMGVNLPIVINEEIIGIIGITGELKRVMGYGQIVRHMTQIMIEDSWIKDERRYDRRVRYRFLEEWLMDVTASHNMAFIKRGLELGIDIRKARRALVIHIANYQQLSDTLKGQEKLEEMEASVRHTVQMDPLNIYLRMPPKQVVLLNVTSDDQIRSFASQLQQMIEVKYGEHLLIGADTYHQGEQSAFQRCSEAEKAATYAIFPERQLVFYDELSLELFMEEISQSTMEVYLKKLFQSKCPEEIEESMNIIEMYFHAKGSITEAADKLYIHKNTLQYKLKKLYEETGKDIRQPQDAAIYYMALLFYSRLYHKPYLMRG